MNDDVTPKNVWLQSVNYIKNLKKILHLFHGFDLENLSLSGTPDSIGLQ